MKKRHRAEQIVAKLRQTTIEPGKSQKAPEACRKLEIREQTYRRFDQAYRLWKKDGMQVPKKTV